MAFPAEPWDRSAEEPRPRPTLASIDAIALIVGIVVGAAIFETPSLVAANAGSAPAILGSWLLGGLISIVGALCYAELATAYPHPGGDYHYLTRAFGARLAFLFAWARMSVIQTGSIALLAFVFGDYMTQIAPLGELSASIYAAGAVILLTALNAIGIRQTRDWQRALTSAQVAGLLLLIAAGLLMAPEAPPVAAAAEGGMTPAFGLVLVFVLLTYGGWNEAAYISAELRDGRKTMMKVMVVSIGIITTLYVLFNLALLRTMTIEQIAASPAVGAELMRIVAGERGALLISLLIAASALASTNAVILTGGRSSFAMGCDFPMFSWLGRWSGRRDTPVNALLVQGGVALALVLLGTLTRNGFKTMVEFTAPVFWFFFLMTAVSLFVLRRREPDVVRPFRVPLYPLTPLLFVATCAYLLWSSLVYTGIGALVGVATLLVGAGLLLVRHRT
ncbi:MAG TPA: amino acid permease [Thermoanaerobaculia bacterium]|nr:amino acid permease [Thermoanaerobaculia bacterium]